MIIPANISREGNIKYSGLIENEIEGLRLKKIEIEPFYITNRYSITRIIQLAYKVKQAISKCPPDLIHIQTGTAALFMMFLKSKTPFIITIGGSDLLGNPGRGLFWKIRGILAGLITTICSVRAKKVICVSRNLKDALPHYLQQKIEIIPRGVDIESFRPLPIDTVRQKLKWNLSEYYVVFSILSKDAAAVKNLPLAQSVISYYADKYDSNIHLELLVNKTKEEVISMLNAANALLVTSIHEGSPNIVKEAMACNLPVVAVNVGDVYERLNSVSPSVVTKTYDEQELAFALRTVIQINAKSNGRFVLIEQGLDRASVSHRIIEIYESCISNA